MIFGVIMKNLPIVICTSVIRSSQQGESHGGMYIVDFNTNQFRQVVDWNDPSIDWEGRGADRGLRGIAFYDNLIVAAASDEVFFYNQQFKIVESFRNPYLKHCHEIYVKDDELYLSSTGYDSLLTFDIKTRSFIKGHCYRKHKLIATGFDIIDRGTHKIAPEKVSSFSYDPKDSNGPEQEDSCHINNVFYKNGNIYFSGRFSKKLMRIDAADNFVKVAKIPKGTHNVQLFEKHILMNSTNSDCILLTDFAGKTVERFDIPQYKEEELTNNTLGKDHARQAFGRGLCTTEGYIIGGSSPGTISLYRRGNSKPLSSINITMDVRNAIHGLEIYPYDVTEIFSA